MTHYLNSTSFKCILRNAFKFYRLSNITHRMNIVFLNSNNNHGINTNNTDFTLQIRGYSKKVQGKAAKGGKPKTVVLTDEELSNVIDVSEFRRKLSELDEKLKQDFFDHLSVHSTAGKIDQIPVSIEGGVYPLNELAQISRKTQNLIVVNLAGFPDGLKPTMQAIADSGMSLNPQQEGTAIYLTVPKVTREHRETLAKNAKTLFTKTKDEVRHIQNYYIKQAKQQTELSEDLVFHATNQIMQIAEHCSTEMEKTLKSKQKELVGDGS